MARENNFLLGNGERLTASVTVSKGGGSKKPPYDFFVARQQVKSWVDGATQHFNQLSSAACPDDQVTAVITMHPRYISKSDFPKDLFDEVGLKAIGGRSKKIRPKQWGIEEHPEEAVTDEIFVMGTRKNISKWAHEIPQWTIRNRGAKHITNLEGIDAFRAIDKVRLLADDRDEVLLEIVLHGSNKRAIDLFESYALARDAQPVMDRLRQTKGLTFIPVYTTKEQVEKLAEFSFVRVVRAMPTMRPLQPNPIRTNRLFPVSLPEEKELDPTIRAAVFDGGLPPGTPIVSWVQSIEPKEIGAPVPTYQEHGLAVTSALLFGPLVPGQDVPRPLCQVDHVRVLDENTGANGDFEYYDVLDRILNTLDGTEELYHFVNLSLGPNIPVDDDEVTRWTASLDERFANGKILGTVAAGNSGNLDAISGLNRIQPPSDAVNLLSVGASDTQNKATWKRVDYSCTGPGRLPGIVKPDGVMFGGSENNPFMVLAPSSSAVTTGTQGTSFAAPYALRSAVAVRAQLGMDFGPLAIRALLIHRADPSIHGPIEVGWGHFETDYERLITCEDDEALVVFQGELPVGEHLRAPVPLPDGELQGMVTITATLVIAPEVDPSFPNAYTRAGLEVAFRPNSSKFKLNKDGTIPRHANTKSFFNQKNIYGVAEYDLREDGHKWEPCLRATQSFRSKTLNKPSFDIYYHHRGSGMAINDPQPIPYALVVSIKVPKIPNFYDRVVRTYSNLLVPLQPKTRIRIRNS